MRRVNRIVKSRLLPAEPLEDFVHVERRFTLGYGCWGDENSGGGHNCSVLDFILRNDYSGVDLCRGASKGVST